MLWGVGHATQDTLFKALVASVLPEGKRNFAFGLFYAGYGVGWLIGTVTTCLLYDRSRMVMVMFALAAQLAALPVFVVAGRGAPKPNLPDGPDSIPGRWGGDVRPAPSHGLRRPVLRRATAPAGIASAVPADPQSNVMPTRTRR